MPTIEAGHWRVAWARLSPQSEVVPSEEVLEHRWRDRCRSTRGKTMPGLRSGEATGSSPGHRVLASAPGPLHDRLRYRRVAQPLDSGTHVAMNEPHALLRPQVREVHDERLPESRGGAGHVRSRERERCSGRRNHHDQRLMSARARRRGHWFRPTPGFRSRHGRRTPSSPRTRRCGTTWMMQIVHQLRTGGSMQFSEIYAVVPFFDLCRARASIGSAPGRPAACVQVASAMGPDPEGVATSMSYATLGTHWCLTTTTSTVVFLEKDAISIDEFAREAFLAEAGPWGRYWDHVASWWPPRERATCSCSASRT